MVGQGCARWVIGVGGKRVERKAVASGRPLGQAAFERAFMIVPLVRVWAVIPGPRTDRDGGSSVPLPVMKKPAP